MNFEEEIQANDRLVASEPISTESAPDHALRPKKLDEYVGQEHLRKSLGIFLQAAKNRGEALDHVLFHGYPGLGKTTLSYIIANEMNAGIKVTSGPVIERQGDLAAILTSLQEGDVLFIDEIHRLNHAVEEILYPAMEDFQLDLIIGQGPGARSVKMDLPRFTLVGATTRTGLLTPPLRDRFGDQGWHRRPPTCLTSAPSLPCVGLRASFLCFNHYRPRLLRASHGPHHEKSPRHKRPNMPSGYAPGKASRRQVGLPATELFGTVRPACRGTCRFKFNSQRRSKSGERRCAGKRRGCSSSVWRAGCCCPAM